MDASWSLDPSSISDCKSQASRRFRRWQFFVGCLQDNVKEENIGDGETDRRERVSIKDIVDADSKDGVEVLQEAEQLSKKILY